MLVEIKSKLIEQETDQLVRMVTTPTLPSMTTKKVYNLKAVGNWTWLSV